MFVYKKYELKTKPLKKETGKKAKNVFYTSLETFRERRITDLFESQNIEMIPPYHCPSESRTASNNKIASKYSTQFHVLNTHKKPTIYKL